MKKILMIGLVTLCFLGLTGLANASNTINFSGNDGIITVQTDTVNVHDLFEVHSSGDFSGSVYSNIVPGGYHGPSTYMDRSAAFGSRISGSSNADGCIVGNTIGIQSNWGSSEDDASLFVRAESDSGAYYAEQNIGSSNTKMGFSPSSKGSWMNPRMEADGVFEIRMSAERYNNIANGLGEYGSGISDYDDTFESGSSLIFAGTAGGYTETFASVGEQNACHSVQFGNKYEGAGYGQGWHYDELQVGTYGDGSGSFTMSSTENVASYGSPGISVHTIATEDSGYEAEKWTVTDLEASTGVVDQMYSFTHGFHFSGYADTD